MSNESVTVTYSLEEILTRLEGKIDNLQQDVTDLKVGQAQLSGEIQTLDEKVDGIAKRLEERLSGEIQSL